MSMIDYLLTLEDQIDYNYIENINLYILHKYFKFINPLTRAEKPKYYKFSGFPLVLLSKSRNFFIKQFQLIRQSFTYYLGFASTKELMEGPIPKPQTNQISEISTPTIDQSPPSISNIKHKTIYKGHKRLKVYIM